MYISLRQMSRHLQVNSVVPKQTYMRTQQGMQRHRHAPTSSVVHKEPRLQGISQVVHDSFHTEVPLLGYLCLNRWEYIHSGAGINHTCTTQSWFTYYCEVLVGKLVV